MLRLGIYTVLLFLAYISQAQTFTMHHFGVAEGLPSAEVYQIFQDSKGFLWFSTDNGVARYDGFQFKTFNVGEGLPDPVVFETLEDSLKQIWIRTYTGKIGYIKNDKFTPYRYNSELSKVCSNGGFIFSIAPVSHGKLWFCSGPLWGAIDSTGRMTLDTIEANYVAFKNIEGRHLVASYRHQLGLNRFLIDGKSYPLELSDNFHAPKVTHSLSLSIEWKGNLYICVNNNIFRYSGEKVERVFRSDNAIISLSTDRQDNLWVGSFSGGAKRFTTDDFSNPWEFPEFEKTSVTDVLEDHEGGIWVSTVENGVFYFPNLNIHHYSLNSTSKIRSVQSRGNQIYVGEYDGTLSSIDAESKKHKVIKKFDGAVLAIFNDRNNTLWVSTRQLNTFDAKNRATLKRDQAIFRDLAQDRNGDIWAAEPSGIYRYNANGNFLESIRMHLPLRNMAAIDTLLVMGSHTGIKIYDHKLNLLKTPTQVANFKISSITQLNDTTILVATIGNSFFITNKSFTRFFHFQLPARNIYSILSVSSSIWLGTEKGILITSVESIIKHEANFQIITKKSGLSSDQISFLSLVGNEVFAFTGDDFAVINASEKKFIDQSPTFYVKNIKVNNSVRDYSNVLYLPYNQNHIQIGFGFIAYNHQDIQVRYRLHPREPWNYTTERVVNLYSLSPGTYTVELQFSVDRTHWKNVPLNSTIHISPPWWGTIWFQLLIVFVILLIIFLFVRNRYNNLQLKTNYQQRLLRSEIDTSERERLRIARELHDRVGTDLSAMKMIIGQLLQKNGEQQSERVENNFQDVIKEIKDIIYNLSPPGLERFGLFQTVKNYIEKLQPIGTQITFNTFGNDVTNAELGIAIFRVLQELLSNSLKHSSAQTIDIHINCFKDVINILYEDNGKGFSPATQKAGMGLQNIEARIRSFDGQIIFESGTFGVSYSIDIPITLKK